MYAYLYIYIEREREREREREGGGLSGKYPAILNISRKGPVGFM